jgi:hypothetical protein
VKINNALSVDGELMALRRSQRKEHGHEDQHRERSKLHARYDVNNDFP